MHIFTDNSKANFLQESLFERYLILGILRRLIKIEKIPSVILYSI